MPEALPVSARPRVLVVDDEQDVCELMSRILADAGYDVDTVTDGAPALEKLQAARYDLLILDLMMPVVEGWVVLEHLRDVAQAPPVLVLTCRGDHESLARGLRERVAAYVIKPFEIPLLLEACRLVVAEASSGALSSERRRARRRAVVVEVLAHGAGGAVLGRGTLVSLGPRGARVLLDTALEPGARLALAVLSLDPHGAVRLEGEVRWTRPYAGRHATGVAFTHLGPEAAHSLAELFPPAR